MFWTSRRWQLIPKEPVDNEGLVINGAVVNELFDVQVEREAWIS